MDKQLEHRLNFVEEMIRAHQGMMYYHEDKMVEFKKKRAELLEQKFRKPEPEKETL